MSQQFEEIRPTEWQGNVFSRIGTDWMLVTSAGEDGVPNTMTASWGGAGILWNKPVAFVFLRPQRYTTGLVDASGKLSLSFFADGGVTAGQRQALRYCGSHSGRDGDKFAPSGLTPAVRDGIPFVAEADSVLFCRVLYRSELCEAAFLDRELLGNYEKQDYHIVYICEITKVLGKR